MMKLKWAKSLMENEEGTNYLWIQFQNAYIKKEARLAIHLPDGLHRSQNLNGYFEDEDETIIIYEFTETTDLVVEIFTEELIPCGERTICVEMRFIDDKNQQRQINEFIKIPLVNEDEVDLFKLDEEVVRRVKKFTADFNEDKEKSEEYVLNPLNISHELSELEEKYRVDFNFNERSVTL
ncbi:hypothetical protein [Chengkuizengella axinellae]|uniref:Uncharacterized protein n=1 Tax=Chengkuizengella axinellae TaxID=3064388 RepID=A0ABT9IVZ2_9BACL|nr:hypothetical protein [Chengkuizengella sp. 2205SS18-9]MDP5273534.1 hypothetical protein [Chengkuizengella sp. 2205SS18-9]